MIDCMHAFAKLYLRRHSGYYGPPILVFLIHFISLWLFQFQSFIFSNPPPLFLFLTHSLTHPRYHLHTTSSMPAMLSARKCRSWRPWRTLAGHCCACSLRRCSLEAHRSQDTGPVLHPWLFAHRDCINNCLDHAVVAGGESSGRWPEETLVGDGD